ncbi:unnamed protein product [Prunus brigantina]
MLDQSSQHHCGSQPDRGPNVDKRRHSWGKNLLEDYFILTSLYSMLIFEVNIECTPNCSIKSCMMFAIMMHTLFRCIMLLGFWIFFRSKNLQLLYECLCMTYLQNRWMRLLGWGNPLS